MAGVLLPSSLDEACELSLEAFMAVVDEDKCEEVEAMLVKVLVEQGVRSVRRLLNTKVCSSSAIVSDIDLLFVGDRPGGRSVRNARWCRRIAQGGQGPARSAQG